ncbi:hypothetical protein WJX82_005642 [Trebouxia sp. C0006]
MPPKKTAPISQGIVTSHRTRSAPAEQPVVASPPKKPKQYASSTDDSDIEVDICDESQAAASSLLQEEQQQPDDDFDEQTSGPAPCPAGPAELTESLHSFAAVTAYLRSRLLDTFSTAAASMEMRSKLQEAYSNLLNLLSNTAETPGANHSFLLLGARGTGKSLVMQRVLTELEAKYNVHEGKPTVGIVRLTGLAHTEDVVAFREIARQLCKAFNCKYSKASSLAENLTFLREMLRELGRGHKVVVFVLDEFDLFAKKAKQTTLYNLLDAMQTADMQAAVVGLSCRHDVMELLEKRVRSRFSHRKQLIPEMEEKDLDSAADSPRGVLAAMLTVPDSTGDSMPHGPVQQWNAAIAQILSADVVMQQLKLMMTQGHGRPRDLADVAMEVMLAMECQPGVPQQQAVLEGIASVTQLQHQQATMVGSCSVLELFILVSTYRIKRRGHDSANFEMVHDEYCKLLEQGGSGDRRSKAAALRAFERLIALSLVSYVDNRAEEKGGLREFHAARVNLVLQEIEAGLKMQKSCPSLLKNALSNEAVRNTFAHG